MLTSRFCITVTSILFATLRRVGASTCGNGALEPISTNPQFVVDCSDSSTYDGHESCDFSHSARFGTFEGGCTVNCTLDLHTPAVISSTGSSDQREAGVLTRAMKNTRYYDFGNNLGHYSNSIAPCLYTDAKNCSDLDAALDRFSILGNCYDVDPASAQYVLTMLT